MKPILIDVFPEWMSGKGIFKTLDGIVTTPWKDDTDGAALDLEYYGNKSGSKIIAPLVEKLLNSDGLSDEKRIALANLIWLKFGTNWSKLWATLTVEYNPIENYSMVEDTTGNTSRNNTASRNNSASSSAATYAFNSTEAVDTDSSAQSGTESGTEAETGQHADHHTRSGNIGVTTSQQMLQSERDLWMWKFYEQVFADVDTILCIEVYGESCGDFSQYSGGGSSYVLPPATASTLGGVKIGSGVNVTADGTISVEGGSGAVESVNGKTGVVVLNYDDVGSPSLQEFQQIEDDVEDNTIMINNHSTEISNNSGAIQNLYDRSPFRFGVDSDGNYGYYKAGADTVTPFLTGGSIDGVLKLSSATGHLLPNNMYISGAGVLTRYSSHLVTYAYDISDLGPFDAVRIAEMFGRLTSNNRIGLFNSIEEGAHALSFNVISNYSNVRLEGNAVYLCIYTGTVEDQDFIIWRE